MQLIKAEIDSSFGKQLLMRSCFSNAVLVDDDDAVGADDGRQTMGNNDSCSVFNQFIKCGLNVFLRLVVKRG